MKARGTGLPTSTLALVRLAAAVSTGDAARTRAAIRRADRSRASSGWVHEVIVQSHLFVGYPRTINALFLLLEIRKGRNGRSGTTPKTSRSKREEPLTPKTRPESRTTWVRRGRRLAERIYGRSFPTLARNLRELHPDLFDWMLTDGYGRVLSRPNLDPLVREFAVIGSLVPLRVPLQLASHLEGARNLGAGAEEIKEAVEAALAESGTDARREALRELRRLGDRR